jgi:hypothetical protein
MTTSIYNLRFNTIAIGEYLFVLLLTLHFVSAKAQDSRVIPPSPVSQEFAKYIDQEVALYNGTPEISIPLYDIKLKGLTIPISLSYHASGIKYGQEDGYVGVGWVLNPGYRISRSINGFADELVSMPSDFSTVLSNYEQSASGGNTPAKVDRDQYLAKFVPGTEFNYGRLDGEYDQFTFSTPTVGGDFIITDRANKIVKTTEESNLLIDYVTGQSVCSLVDGIRGFQILDDQGNKFAFGEYNPQTECVLETASGYYGGTVATAWGISEITTPIGDQVKFNYSREDAGEFTDYMRTFTVSEGSNGGAGCNLPTTANENIFTGHGYYSFRPDEITSPNEAVVFHYSQDPLYPKKIWKIEINTSTGANLRTVEFYYTKDTHHVFLDHIAIRDSDQNEVQTYRFEYYAQNTPETFTLDHYGNYLTTYNPNTFYHVEFLDDPIVATDFGSGTSDCFNETMNYYMEGLTVSREPHEEDSSVPSYFSLKKITYPTGGYTEYEYEHGEYRDVGQTWPVRKAGIRIKTIRTYDGVSQEPIVKRYVYGTDENGYGYADAWLLHPEYLFVKETIGMNLNPEPPANAEAQRVITYSSTILGDIGSVFCQSGFVKYPSVTEYYSNVGSASIGKTVYYYDVGHLFDIQTLPTRNLVANEVYGGSPYYVYRYHQWDKPLLKRKVAYSYANGVYTPLREELFEYNDTSTTYVGLKVEQSATNGSSVINIESYGPYYDPTMLDRYFNYGQYYFDIGKNTLTHKTELQYDNGDTISTEHWYDYSNLLLSKETVARSTGDHLVNFTTYPLDYASGTAFVDDMKVNRLISYPIEKVSCLDNGSSLNVLAGSISQYKPGGKGFPRYTVEYRGYVAYNFRLF